MPRNGSKSKKNFKIGELLLEYEIRGKVYQIRSMKALNDKCPRGLCYDPANDNPMILIRDDLTGDELIEIIIHECLHACFWDLDEHAIDQSASTISGVLSALGHLSKCKK